MSRWREAAGSVGMVLRVGGSLSQSRQPMRVLPCRCVVLVRPHYIICRMRARLLLALLAVTVVAYAKTALLEHIRLQWKPTSDLQLGALEMAQTPIHFETFQDARQNKEAIG